MDLAYVAPLFAVVLFVALFRQIARAADADLDEGPLTSPGDAP